MLCWVNTGQELAGEVEVETVAGPQSQRQEAMERGRSGDGRSTNNRADTLGPSWEASSATGGGGWKTPGEENTFLATFISPLRELLPTSGLHQLKGWTK